MFCLFIWVYFHVIFFSIRHKQTAQQNEWAFSVKNSIWGSGNKAKWTQHTTGAVLPLNINDISLLFHDKLIHSDATFRESSFIVKNMCVSQPKEANVDKVMYFCCTNFYKELTVTKLGDGGGKVGSTKLTGYLSDALKKSVSINFTSCRQGNGSFFHLWRTEMWGKWGMPFFPLTHWQFTWTWVPDLKKVMQVPWGEELCFQTAIAQRKGWLLVIFLSEQKVSSGSGMCGKCSFIIANGGGNHQTLSPTMHGVSSVSNKARHSDYQPCLSSWFSTGTT